MRKRALAFILAATPGASRAAEIVVVAPPAAGAPYQEALRGVCDALGACPPVLEASDDRLELPQDVRVVIALGGRAARRRYPARAALVTALAPGYDARPLASEGAVVRVRLAYSPREFVRRLKAAKPGAVRLALLWATPVSGRYAASVVQEGAREGMTVESVEVPEPDELPALLRSIPAGDAVWLAPDPELITPTAFDTVREYARSLGAVFFSPAPGLAARGADPALAPAFREAGLRAAEEARELLAGRRPDADSYPGGEPAAAPVLLVSTRAHAAQP